MFTPLEAVRSRRAMRASRDTAAALPTRSPSRPAMICRARRAGAAPLWAKSRLHRALRAPFIEEYRARRSGDKPSGECANPALRQLF